ncbi:MAG: hypothetical protein ACFE95_02930 [Candidatus Hodarchaeota archaeon]
MRFNLLILISLSFFSVFLSGEAASSSLLVEELTYLVKAGDQKTFTFSKFLFEGMDEYNVTIDDDNGNPRVIFLKKNIKITIH